MRRRDFIKVVAGSAVAWPLSGRAQRERIPRICVLMSVGDDWAAGDAALERKFATELVTLTPDVILATASPTVAALQAVTRTVPIVFAHSVDPVGAGFVDSLARPGGNATGFVLYEYGIGVKWLELLKEIAPNVTRVAVLRDPAIAAGIGQFGAIQSIAPTLGV